MIDIRFSELDGFTTISTFLKEGRSPGPLGLVRPIRLPLALALQRNFNVPVLFITGQMNRAQVLMEEMQFWSENSQGMLFPEPVPLFYEDASWDESTRAARLSVLETLSRYWIPGQKPQTGRPPFVIASIKALMARTLPRRDFILARKVLKIGQAYDLEGLLLQIVRLGYEFHEIVSGMGQFSRRGGIVDIWLVGEDHPVRIEFFGDEIESIRLFDENSQRSIKTLEQCSLVPTREYLLPEQGKTDEIMHRRERDICVLHPQATSLFSYLPKGSLVFLDDQDILITVSEEVEKDAMELRQQLVVEKDLPHDFPVPYYSWSELYDQMLSFTPLNMSFSGMETLQLFRQDVQPAPHFGGKLGDLLDFLDSETAEDHQVTLISRQSERLQKLWEERVNPADRRFALVQFVNESISSGWKMRYPDQRIEYLISDDEIFGWQPAIRRKRRKLLPDLAVFDIGSFEVGDYVVHFEYGIARYRGLVTRMLEGVEKEYLFLEFADGDELYVPVHQAERISQYIGPDARPPRLTSLGSPAWQGMKNRVSHAVQYVAKDLLELYSKRQSVAGYAFHEDSDWQREL
ncbi:MAG: hypothetical protein GYA52_07440, partial [Chloroflexi bacterium]|nr:hypothetical protein [Chloroflexota bacterium]